MFFQKHKSNATSLLKTLCGSSQKREGRLGGFRISAVYVDERQGGVKGDTSLLGVRLTQVILASDLPSFGT